MSHTVIRPAPSRASPGVRVALARAIVVATALLTAAVGVRLGGPASSTGPVLAVALVAVAVLVRPGTMPEPQADTRPLGVTPPSAPADALDRPASDPGSGAGRGSAADALPARRADAATTSMELFLGRTVDGCTVRADAAGGIAVVGSGALARAVYDAVVAQLVDTRSPDDTVRAVDDGVAVTTLVTVDGSVRGAVVLASDGVRPRRTGTSVTVTRYGCRVDGPDHVRSVIDPVLPTVDPTVATVAMPSTSGHPTGHPTGHATGHPCGLSARGSVAGS